MDFDLKIFLDDLKLTPEERTQAEALFTPRVDVLKSRVMAQADYSRNMDNLRKLKDGLTAKETAIENDFARVAQFEAKMGEILGTSDVNQVAPALQTLLTDRETLKAQYAAMEAELKKHAGEYGFEFKPPVGGTPNTPNTPVHKQNTVDTTKFVTRDEVTADLRSTYPQVAAQIHDINIQHTKLFGAPLENASELVALSMQSAQDAIRFRDPSREKTPSQIWQEKYNVSGKLAEVAEAGIQARIAKGIEEDRIKRASQQGNSPIPNAGLPGSPVIGAQFKPVVDATKVVNAGNQNRGVEGAMQRFGTYYGGQSQ